MTSTTPPALQNFVSGQLSFRSKAGHVALLLGALLMTVAIGSLWATERALPLRTQLAFAVMIVIGLSWVVFSTWVLTVRRPLYARHRVVASALAVLFTSLFVIGAFTASYIAGGTAPLVAGGTGILMLTAAVMLLIRAHRTHRRLIEQRAILEQEISGGAK